jgi:hypothetical protein
MAGILVYFISNVILGEKHSPWSKLEDIFLVDIQLTIGEVSKNV